MYCLVCVVFHLHSIFEFCSWRHFLRRLPRFRRRKASRSNASRSVAQVGTIKTNFNTRKNAPSPRFQTRVAGFDNTSEFISMYLDAAVTHLVPAPSPSHPTPLLSHDATAILCGFARLGVVLEALAELGRREGLFRHDIFSFPAVAPPRATLSRRHGESASQRRPFPVSSRGSYSEDRNYCCCFIPFIPSASLDCQPITLPSSQERTLCSGSFVTATEEWTPDRRILPEGERSRGDPIDPPR